jgi:hypothetical protein
MRVESAIFRAELRVIAPENVIHHLLVLLSALNPQLSTELLRLRLLNALWALVLLPRPLAHGL